MEDLGRNKRITGLDPVDYGDEPETVSAPLPRRDPAAWDPNFEGSLPSNRQRADVVTMSGDPAAHARVTEPGAQSALDVSLNREREENPAPAPRHIKNPMPAEVRAPLTREPTPHRTQPPVDLMSEDDEASAIDYAHESDYTTRRGSMLSGAGYRRSRSDERRFKEGLKYGQYLEVPKGRRDLFATKKQQRNRRVAIACIAVVAVAVVVWIIVALAMG